MKKVIRGTMVLVIIASLLLATPVLAAQADYTPVIEVEEAYESVMPLLMARTLRQTTASSNSNGTGIQHEVAAGVTVNIMGYGATRTQVNGGGVPWGFWIITSHLGF